MAIDGQPLVSVVIAAYQQPAFLKEALQSVLAQTYRPIEIIVVDDASGEQFTSQYRLPPQATLIVHETRRATAAITRNTGIRAARGQYIAFLDQDDIWLPQKLAWQVEQLEQNPSASLTFGHFRWVDSQLNELPEQLPSPQLQQDVLRQMLIRNFIECPSQVLIRRNVLDKIGPFDENIRGTAAWELYIRAAAAGTILSDPRIMTLYRQHENQWSQDSLMMRKGSARTMAKTAGWVFKSRRDLWLLVHKRWSRWLREVARAQFHSREERPQAMRTLLEALRVWPLDMQSYAVLVKGLFAKVDRPQQVTGDQFMQVRLFKPRVREEAIEAAAQVMRSGWLGMGPVTANFEKAFAKYLGVSRAVAVNTCTSALHLAVKLLRLPRGAEVITSPLTFVAANEVLLYEGLVPVFADIDRATGNLSPHSVRSRITERTGAIMLTHFGGYACDLEEFRALERPIIEDCAHACGAWYRDQRVGASGNLCAFSFDPIKNLTTGDGGMLIVPDEAQEQRARSLRYMGLNKDAFTRVNNRSAYSWEYDVPEVGYRYHMNDIAAALGLVHLRDVDADNQVRTEIATKYRALLGDVPGLHLLDCQPDRKSSYHLFSVLAESRDGLADKLTRADVIIGGHYARTDLYPIFARAQVPEAEYFCSRVLSLPMHVDLTDDEIQYVAKVIREGW